MQKKLLDSEMAKEKFKDTFDLFMLVEQVRNKLPENEDWIPKAQVLEMGIYMQSQNSIRFSADVPGSSTSDRIPIEVRIEMNPYTNTSFFCLLGGVMNSTYTYSFFIIKTYIFRGDLTDVQLTRQSPNTF